MNFNGSNYADLLNESTISADEVIIGSLILPNLSPNSVPYIDDQHNVVDRVLTNGHVLIGQSGGPPLSATLTGTANEIIVSNGPGAITLSTPQPIASTSDPTFHNLTVTAINGKVGNDLVTGPASAVDDRIASYDGTTGKVIKDSALNTADVFLRTGTVAATGNFNLNSNELQNVSALRPSSSNIIIGTAASATAGSNIVIGNSSTVPSSSTCVVVGNSNSLGFNCTNATLVGDSVTLTAFGGMDQSVFVGNNITSQGGSRIVIIGKSASNDTGNDNVIVGCLSSITGGAANSTVIGAASTMSGIGGVSIGYGNITGGASVTIGSNNTCTLTRAHSIGIDVSNATANSFLIDARTNVRCNVDNMTDLGTTTSYWKDGYFKGSLIGGTNSRTCDNIVSNTGTGTAGNLASFVSDKVIQDSGIANTGPWLPLAGGAMTGAITGLTSLNGTAVTNYIITPSTSNLNMNTHSISGITTLDMNDILTQSNTTDASSLTTASIVTLGGLAVTKKTFIGDDVVIGPSQTITQQTKLTLRGTASSTSGPHVTAYGSTDQYPIAQQLNWAHNNIALNFDCYYNGNWRSSLSNSYYQIYKTANQLQFNYGSGTAAGGVLTLTTAGYVDTSGILQWQKPITTASTTDSTSSTTGAIINSGGMGIAKRLNIGTQCAIGVNRATALSALEVVGTGGINVTDGASVASVKQCNITYNTASDRTEITSIHQGTAFTDIQFACSNIGFQGVSFGGGYGTVFLANATTVPTSNPTGGGLLYCSGGALKFRGYCSGLVLI